MTLLSDLARDLSLGHLSDLPAFGEGLGTLDPVQRTKFLMRTNDALRALYSRFPLQRRTIIVEAIDGIQQYPLRAEYALTSGSAQPNKFIKDSLAEPFLEDVLAIEHVYDRDHSQLGLNDRNDMYSLHTPSFDVLQIDRPVTGILYHVEYRAAHVPVPMTTTDLATIRLRVPTVVYTALKFHIAAGIHEGAGNDGAILKANMYMTQYENECTRLENSNALNQSMVDGNMGLERGGWV